MRRILVSNVLGLVGATIGGVLGYFVFSWIYQRGFYGMMIPGALLGLGCSLLATERSVARGVVCGVAAVVLGLYTEWKFFPFKADGGFTYLLRHVPDLNGITLLMIGAGGFFGYWLGKDASPLFGGGTPPVKSPRPNANPD